MEKSIEFEGKEWNHYPTMVKKDDVSRETKSEVKKPQDVTKKEKVIETLLGSAVEEGA